MVPLVPQNLARSSHGSLGYDIGNVAPKMEDFFEEAFNDYDDPDQLDVNFSYDENADLC